MNYGKIFFKNDLFDRFKKHNNKDLNDKFKICLIKFCNSLNNNNGIRNLNSAYYYRTFFKNKGTFKAH